MAKKKKELNSKKLSEAIVLGMQEKKGFDIVVMDLRKVKNAGCSRVADTTLPPRSGTRR